MWLETFPKKEKKIENLSLHELEDKVYDIIKRQNYISNCDLSYEVTVSAFLELEGQKKVYKEFMHKKIDEL